MNCIKDGKYTGDSCFGCKVYAVECEIRDKVYRNRWIPVSEGLPKESRYYLCTVVHYGASTKELLDSHDIEIQASTESMFFNKDNKRWGKWNDVNNFKVTAWQPLPEPYKEGQ